MKILSPKVHGLIADYAGAALLFMAPALFGFEGTPATLSYVVGGFLLAMSLLTAYPMGVMKVIPFTTHGAIELVTSLALPFTPWLFRFAEQEEARNFFVGAGIVLFLVWLTTDYRAGNRTTGGTRMSQRERDREPVLAGR